MNRAIESIALPMWKVCDHLTVTNIPREARFLLVFDNHNETIDDKYKFRLSFARSCFSLGATRERLALPIRSTFLLPRSCFSDVAQEVAHKLISSFLVLILVFLDRRHPRLILAAHCVTTSFEPLFQHSHSVT
ncbi:hypothetical protein D3C81_995200 [compost metagenome]